MGTTFQVVNNEPYLQSFATDVPNTWTILPSKWKRTQKVLMWALKKLGMTSYVHQERFEKWKPVTVDTSNIMREITRQAHNIERMAFGKAKYIVVGHDMYSTILRDPYIFESIRNGISYSRFQIPDDIRQSVQMGSYRTDLVLRGMEVVVVPWVNGIFLLPHLGDGQSREMSAEQERHVRGIMAAPPFYDNGQMKIPRPSDIPPFGGK